MMPRLRAAWRRHRLLQAALGRGNVHPDTARIANSESYLELLVYAGLDTLELAQAGRDEHLDAELLLASGAVYGGEEYGHA